MGQRLNHRKKKHKKLMERTTQHVQLIEDLLLLFKYFSDVIKKRSQRNDDGKPLLPGL